MAHEENLIYWIWLADGLGAGSRLGSRLLAEYGSPEAVYKQNFTKVVQRLRLHHKDQIAVHRLFGSKNSGTVLSAARLNIAREILARCREKDIHILPCEDPAYPEALYQLPNKPLVLYYKGTLPVLRSRLRVAVVGTRTMSEYGRNMGYAIGYGLAAGGAVVISGMALGVDSISIAGALDARGTVIAVLGSGADVIYPTEHTTLYHKILQNGGCILSEYPPGTEPDKKNFPLRNRIISGLSDAGVIVEASANSGALITARHLLFQGRRLFAVPGRVGEEGAEGTNDLIRDGSQPVLAAVDVLQEFAYLHQETVSVQKAWQVCFRVDMQSRAIAAMERYQISAKGNRNFEGSRTYGGRRKPDSNQTRTPAEYPEWMYTVAAEKVAGAKVPSVPSGTPARQPDPVSVRKIPVSENTAADLAAEKKEKAPSVLKQVLTALGESVAMGERREPAVSGKPKKGSAGTERQGKKRETEKI